MEAVACDAIKVIGTHPIIGLLKHKTIEDAHHITWKEASEELGGLPPVTIFSELQSCLTPRFANQ